MNISQEDYMNSVILITNNTEDDGYVCSLTPNGEVLLSVWANNDTRNIRYPSLTSTYEHSKIFVNSDLVNYTSLHKSKNKFCLEFIQYYEDKEYKSRNPTYVIRTDS
jgi:hypothetical protein